MTAPPNPFDPFSMVTAPPRIQKAPTVIRTRPLPTEPAIDADVQKAPPRLSWEEAVDMIDRGTIGSEWVPSITTTGTRPIFEDVLDWRTWDPSRVIVLDLTDRRTRAVSVGMHMRVTLLSRTIGETAEEVAREFILGTRSIEGMLEARVRLATTQIGDAARTTYKWKLEVGDTLMVGNMAVEVERLRRRTAGPLNRGKTTSVDSCGIPVLLCQRL